MKYSGFGMIVGGLVLLPMHGFGFLSGYPGFLLSMILGLPATGIVLLSYDRFMKRHAGIDNDYIQDKQFSSKGPAGLLLGILMIAYYIIIYFGKDISIFNGSTLHDWFTVHVYSIFNPLSEWMAGEQASNWFVYTTMYTWVVLVFAIRMIMKYRHNNYQILRTFSVTIFQLGLGFMIPAFLKATSRPEYFFSYFWPLKPEYLWPEKVLHWIGEMAKGNPGVYFIAFSAFMSFIAVPILTFFYGKRWYCSWVCGCGGLAETMGDPFRQLSSKSLFSWKMERWSVHLVLLVITSITILLWVNSLTGGEVLKSWSDPAAKYYGFFIISIFSGVVGVGFYPWFGTRVWCRFGCPMAAILGIIQKYFSRFRITTNGEQCISCGNCSTYCEMGIDVRWYAQRNQNIVRASCVGCGVCAAVCPRGVLKLENGPLTDRKAEPGTHIFH